MIKWGGTVYRLHPLLIVMMALAAATGYFVELTTLFGIILIHELGHVAAARGFGWKVTEVQLMPFGGIAAMDAQGAPPAREEVLVALAGPLQNALMAGFAVVMHSTGIWNSAWSLYFLQANVLLGLFNLLPLQPLDGGKLLQAALSSFIPYHRTMVIAAWTSMAGSIVLLAIAMAGLFSGHAHLPLALLSLFLLYANWHTYRNIPYLFIRFLVHREHHISKLLTGGTLARPIAVAGKGTVAETMKLFMRERYHLIYIINADGQVAKVLPEQRLTRTFFIENDPNRAVSELFM